MQGLKKNFASQEDNKYIYNWNFMPDSLLLCIFQYLSPKELLNAGLTCKTWLRISYDEVLWKNLFRSHFNIPHSLGISPGKKSWLLEFKRLTYCIPSIQTEILMNHTHQVLHVAFAHNGKLFATCSKDCSVMVWDSSYPVSIKYKKDMKIFHWNHTQFCQFNSSDTLLLVSGVYFVTPLATSGEIAVFSLQGGFNLQCRILNKPYNILGSWYSDHFLLSGDQHWLTQLHSSSIIWLNKASQETSSEHVPIISKLCNFCNYYASSICTLMVADCLTSHVPVSNNLFESSTTFGNNKASIKTTSATHLKSNKFLQKYYLLNNNFEKESSAFSQIESDNFINLKSLKYDLENATPIFYDEDYRKAEMENNQNLLSNEYNDWSSEDESFSESESEVDWDGEKKCGEDKYMSEKLLIFSTGSKTFIPHQIGFKKIKPFAFPEKMALGLSLAERKAKKELKNSRNILGLESNWLENDSIMNKLDEIDHSIDLHGRIIGMGLSPDHRYLYVNSRPWPQGYVIENPLNSPPIAQNIDIHVIDLVTLKEVGRMLRIPEVYTLNNECFFIFINVCEEYVASGAEDNHGYLWDRHYGICLAKYPHNDVVNSVAFNPLDPEMMVTASDDHTIKIWRSKHRVKQLRIKNNFGLPKCLEIYLRN